MSKKISFIVGCFFLFCFSLLPINIGLSHDAMTMIGIFIGAIVMWLFVDVGWPSLLILFSLTQLTDVTITSVMSNSLGNNTIAFLIFSCILTYSLSTTGLLRRIALWFCNTKIAKKSPWAFAAMYFMSILIIGSFIAPTVLFVLYFALAKEIYTINNLEKGNPYAKMLMAGTAIMTSISCAMTPIAHTFPLMAIGYYEAATGNSINWLKYMAIGIPAGIGVALSIFGILYLGFKKQILNFKVKVLESNNTISKNEIISLITFGIVVIIWLVSGLFPSLFPILKTWTTTIPPIFGIVILCLFGILNFGDALKNGVPWVSIILCATTLAVGKYLTAEELGITDALGSVIGKFLINPTAPILILVIIAFTVIMTNFMSNIVTTTVSYNLLMPIVLTTGILSPALATVLIGMCASMAYATPPSIAHIALAAGSEHCDSKTMLKYGGITTIISIFWVFCVTLIIGGIF
jgi:sodium-dependent dicarboxylate transporter 2/3/5